MTPLADLIAYHRQREQTCRSEIDHCAELLRKNRAFTEDDCKRCVETWNEERRFARDTASWLETIKSRTETAS